MQFSANSTTLHFLPVKLSFRRLDITNLFAKKNDKTVAETVRGKRFASLATQIKSRYAGALNEPLGEFLFGLKTEADAFYRRFLNPYGDEVYCDLAISEHLTSRGLYVFAVAGQVKYIGRSHDPFGKRINQGYGHISPKNCYRDGQATNCHLNALIARHRDRVSAYLCPIENDASIDSLERELIRQEQPEWNIALKW